LEKHRERKMPDLLTNPKLLDALRAAALTRMSYDELRQQRIDYIVACLSDEGTSVTKAQVVKELEKLAGAAA
jgi:hypothetical protein